MGDWTDVALERAVERTRRENLEELSRSQTEDIEKLSDEDLFALSFKAYGARLERRQAQQRDALFKRHGVPEELFRFVKLAQRPELCAAAQEILERYGPLPREVFELIHVLAASDRRATILQLAKTLDCEELDQKLHKIWAKQPRLEFCSGCRAIGYWKPLGARQRFRQLCDSCAAEDHKRREKHAHRDFAATLSGARSRARVAGLPVTLTKKQWSTTLRHFEHRCAYCDKIFWEVIEHVTPIKRGGGTTWGNCLPACFSCNGIKESRTIEELPLGDSIGFNVGVITRALNWLQCHGRQNKDSSC